MSTVQEQIAAKFRQARIDRDEPTKMVIGMLKARVINALKSGGGREENEEMWQEILAAYSKELGKAIAQYEEIGEKGDEQKAESQFELDFCEQFLPKKLGEVETMELVKKLAADNGIAEAKMMGRLMGLVMKDHKETVDGDIVRRCAQAVLNG